MAEKSNRSFQLPFYLVAIFLTILVVTLIIFSSLTLKLNYTTIAQQQPPFNGDLYFDNGNVTFSHHMVSVNGIQLHYVIGGLGDPIVLLHGWPETWYEWRHIMPALAKNYTVIAPDLRGLGDSSKPLTGYDGKTVAEDIHQLVTQLGFKTIFLVGHDIGTGGLLVCSCTSYGSKEVSSHGSHYSWVRTCRNDANMVAIIP
jgi:hypothetical protein